MKTSNNQHPTSNIQCLACALAFFTSLATCHSSLTATVQPGYQFPLDGSVAPTYDLLNQLALPTIAIMGTVGGSNTLAPASVTVEELNTSVADGETLDFNGLGGTLQVRAQGIHAAQLNTTNWLWPLSQPSAGAKIKLNANPQEFSTNYSGLALNYNAAVFTTNTAGLTLASQTNSVPMTDGGGNGFMAFLGPGLTTSVSGGRTNLDLTDTGFDYRSGSVTVAASGVAQTVTFSSAMADANYSVALTFTVYSGSSGALSCTAKTAAGFTLRAETTGIGVDYIAIHNR